MPLRHLITLIIDAHLTVRTDGTDGHKPARSWGPAGLELRKDLISTRFIRKATQTTAARHDKNVKRLEHRILNVPDKPSLHDV